MQRRGPVRLGAFLITIAVALLVTLATTSSPGGPVVSAQAVAASPADDPPPAPSGTVSEFYPEYSNLSDCVGLVEKPGCGSEARGGWRQTLVFVALFAGLGVVLWRVARGIRANRAVVDASVASDGRSTNSTPVDPSATNDAHRPNA